MDSLCLFSNTVFPKLNTQSHISLTRILTEKSKMVSNCHYFLPVPAQDLLKLLCIKEGEVFASQKMYSNGNVTFMDIAIT